MASSSVRGRNGGGRSRARTARSSTEPPRAAAKLAGRLRAVPMPGHPAPMLCTLVAEPFDDPEWTFEPKFDGLRVLVRFDGRRLTLTSRNGKEQSRQFPDVADALRTSLKGPAIVDGEIVCLDDQGRSSFRALQQRFHLLQADEIRARMERHPASIYVFDVLYVDRYDVTGLPLAERKPLLRQAVRWSDRVRWTESTPGEGTRLLRQACRDGGEGIIGKRLDSPYVAARSDAWVKVKCLGRQELVIGGFTDPQRSRVGLGALLVGYYTDDGRHLRYAGKVGTGFTRETLLELREKLEALEQDRSPFDPAGELPQRNHVHWVKPRLVAEIAFAEWTQNDLLRQPRFEGLRPDKAARDCRRERPSAQAEAEMEAGAGTETARRRRPTHSRSRSRSRSRSSP